MCSILVYRYFPFNTNSNVVHISLLNRMSLHSCSCTLCYGFHLELLWSEMDWGGEKGLVTWRVDVLCCSSINLGFYLELSWIFNFFITKLATRVSSTYYYSSTGVVHLILKGFWIFT